MKALWAPWRMEYLKDHKNSADCVFCDFLNSNDDKTNLILRRFENTFIILNKFPYNCGHLMVVPNIHISKVEELPKNIFSEMTEKIQLCSKIIQSAYKPEGFNIGMNVGTAGGAGIKDHLHMHIVPRWVGDTNFMPVLAETKTMPEHLLATYDKLEKALKQELR
jgi:ATP adenylyltransferase